MHAGSLKGRTAHLSNAYLDLAVPWLSGVEHWSVLVALACTP